MAYIMEEMTVEEFADAQKKVKTVIIPVGCVEQHGYHLPLSVDLINAGELPRRAGDRLKAVVAPTVPYSFSGGELPGTVNVSPQVFALYLSDICTEFARMGFKNIVVMLGHGGTDNTFAAKSSLEILLRRHPHLRDVTFSVVEVFYLSPTWMELFTTGAERDFHAGTAETSLLMYWKPEIVRDKIVMDEPDIAKMMRTDQDWFEKREKLVDNDFIIPVVSQRAEIKVGVMGFPDKASPELGEKICGEVVEGLVKFIDELENRQI